ncbi:MAG: tetratricopeptide repeat protein [Muribaculaceae bacterium]|nr:tetratricopeptide repeat protein [Muribaculaceae bacterium]MDE6331977.1 tetratricopeptide repeat protein [Muribaculaceae bacterium]
MKVHRIVLLVIAAIIIGASALARPKKSDGWETRAARQKADYIFLEAQNAYNQQDYSLYGRLLQRAFETDSSDLSLGAQLGQWQIVGIAMDQQKGMEGLQRMRKYYEANPSDYYSGLSLAKTYANIGKIDDFLAISKILYNNFPDKNNVALQLAEGYLRRDKGQDFDSAMTIYRRLEQGFDTGIENSITSYIIGAYMFKNDTTAVLNELDKIYKAAPRDIPTLLTVGGSMIELHRADSALRYFNEAKAIEPDNGGVIMGFLGYYNETGDSTAFLNTLKKAVVNQELEPEEKFMFVRGFIQSAHADSSKFDICCELCESYIANNPGTVEIHTLYASLLNSADRPAEAAEQLSYAIALLPSDLDLRLWHLSLLYRADKKELATDVAEEYAAEFPAELSFARFAAAQLYEQGKYAQAAERFRQFPVDSLKTDESKSDYYATLGDFMSKLDPRSDSYPYYQKAIELNPLNDMAMNNLAYFYSLDGNAEDLEKAEHYSAMAIRHQPDNPTFLDTYAWVKFKQKDFQTARKYIDQTISILDIEHTEEVIDSIVGGNADTADITPADTATDNNTAEFIDVLETSSPDTDDNPEGMTADVLDHAGDIYFMTGEPGQALQFWKRALALDPENALIQKKVKHKTYFYE